MTKIRKILAYYVLYNPDESLLRENLASLVPHVDKVYVWDNSAHSLGDSFFSEFGEKLIYHPNGTNAGISTALNFGWRFALENGYSHFLTMDQDSIWVGLGNFLEKTEDLQNKVGLSIWGPAINEKDSGNGYTEEAYLITSGCLSSVPLIASVGGYDESLFIDAIDIDYCLRLRAAGCKCYRLHSSYIIHRYGLSNEVHFGRRIIHTLGYNPERLYGIVESNFRIARKYHDSAYTSWMVFKYWCVINAARILLFEDNKLKKLSATFRGWRDGSRVDWCSK